jgi:serine/threonine protein kinase
VFFLFIIREGENKTDEQLAKIIKETPLTFVDKIPVSKETKDLIRRMLEFDSKSRISFNDLYKHEYIDQILDFKVMVGPMRHGIEKK